MATSKQHELTILNNYHGERLTEEPLDDRPLDAVQQQLPNRSRAAIKKKYLLAVPKLAIGEVGPCLGAPAAKGAKFVQKLCYKTLTRDVACSHIRAWRLFQETLLNKAAGNENRCEFTAFSCPGGLKSFERGFCFPHLPNPNSSLAFASSYRSDIGRFGEDIKGEGVMFFVTRGSPPYCGTQVQASIHISPKTGPIKGVLLLNLKYPHHSVAFQIECDSNDFILTGSVMSGLAVADYGTLTENIETIAANLKYIDLDFEEENNNTYIPPVFVDKVVVRDMYSNTWQFCQKDTILKDSAGDNYVLEINLSREICF